jgi:beta-galactosidase
MLDYWRFLSDSVAEFQREQVDILRKANAKWFITHNGLMQHVDYWKFTEDLDFLGVDIYPGFDPGNDHGVSFLADRTRSYAGSFMVPELESGPGGQVEKILPTPRPGQMRMWLYQVIAHGADAVMHFRWRSCRFGAEEYWCGVLDHDNKPRRRYEEFAREGIELRHIGNEILGTSVDISAGVLMEYDQEHAWRAMPMNMPGPSSQATLLHKELWRRKLPVGIIEPHDSFEGLKLLIVPSFTMMDEDLADRLAEFVRHGGVLVVMAWSGTRDRFNRITHLSAPGLLAELVGATVEEFGRLEKDENTLVFADGTSSAGHMWYELLRPTTAKPVARWSREHLAGTAAMTVNSFGQGKVFYVGTYAAAEEAPALLRAALEEAKIEPIVPGLPECVEAVRRVGEGKTLLFLLNHSWDEQTISRLPSGVDLISGKGVANSLTLPPKEVALIHVGRNLSVR